MKYTLKRSYDHKVEIFHNWNINELKLEGAELIEALKAYLTDAMEGILDPDTAGKKPDGYLNNLQSGRLGDFSKRYIIIAEDNDKVIGILICLPDKEKTMHIYSLGVIKEYRKKGIASALLARCINDMLKNNINEVILDVHSDNIPARNLYSKFGFK
ncbi:GNAT family N-acetyltransferase [Clostridium sp. YIM B02515]|uniref:GNAT family N-acetyltransferase n=1 Tax=Clostridium rhizosphaerae TaxID=2803861 RepID=A0ABS1TGR8_9CLOT|nr:GNAT family N-acetyltransferase [Clostridium rhizosphaerae]MBL4938593.1 GNAT family N-acetyltransferase [Clostridium rhizosphaerae]